MSTLSTIARLTGIGAFVLLSFLPGLQAQQGAPVAGGGASGAPAPAPAATFVSGRTINMRPNEKRPLALKENERNPYAKRSANEELDQEEGDNAEELRIRDQLSKLRVTGRSHGPNGLRVLLGENLRVVELNEDTVVLGWLDIETNELTGKSMQVAYDLSPSVTIALQGQVETGGGEEGVSMRRMGVLRVGQDRKKSESGMAAREAANQVPPEVFKAGQ
jgi:hypothetical protein